MESWRCHNSRVEDSEEGNDRKNKPDHVGEAVNPEKDKRVTDEGDVPLHQSGRGRRRKISPGEQDYINKSKPSKRDKTDLAELPLQQ